jgi:hypothetical protein
MTELAQYRGFKLYKNGFIAGLFGLHTEAQELVEWEEVESILGGHTFRERSDMPYSYDHVVIIRVDRKKINNPYKSTLNAMQYVRDTIGYKQSESYRKWSDDYTIPGRSCINKDEHLEELENVNRFFAAFSKLSFTNNFGIINMGSKEI